MNKIMHSHYHSHTDGTLHTHMHSHYGGSYESHNHRHSHEEHGFDRMMKHSPHFMRMPKIMRMKR